MEIPGGIRVQELAGSYRTGTVATGNATATTPALMKPIVIVMSAFILMEAL